MQTEIIFGVVVLVFSVVAHEVAHGYMAHYLGDPTARLMGRLTLNPIPHIDPIGSILLPFILIVTGSPFFIGYAKPVPYNPYNLRGRYGETWVALAGPVTNILLALIFALAIRFLGGMLTSSMLLAFGLIVKINLVLAVFNLIPVPPLDGSKVLSGILLSISAKAERVYDEFRRNFERLGMLSGTLLILVIFMLLSPLFSRLIAALFTLLTGLSI